MINNAKSVNNNLFINFRKLFLLDPSNVNFIYSENRKKSKGSKKLNIISYHKPFLRNGSRGFFLWVKEIKLHLRDPGQRYIDTEINFNIFIGLSNSSTYFNFNKCFIGQKSIFDSLPLINMKHEWFMPQQKWCWSKEQIDRTWSLLYIFATCDLSVHPPCNLCNCLIFAEFFSCLRHSGVPAGSRISGAALYSSQIPAINHLYYQFSCHILRSGRGNDTTFSLKKTQNIRQEVLLLPLLDI